VPDSAGESSSAGRARPQRRVIATWRTSGSKRSSSSSHSRVPKGLAYDQRTFAATLPVGVSAGRELADLVLAERLPAWQVRQAVRGATPPGIEVSDVFDVWVGAPAIAANVAAADYVVTLQGDPDQDAIGRAATRLLGAERLDRQRVRGDRVTTYDLRPLVDSIRIVDGPPAALQIRTRFHPERGTGRPEEVVAALADLAGCVLEAAQIMRERVLLSDDLV
jgi:radical SAM-linked protein